MTVQQIKEACDVTSYDPETGKLTWKYDVGKKVKAGDNAAHLKKSSGTYIIKHNSRTLPAWKVVAFHINSEKYSPFFSRNGCCMFKDGDKSNLRADNLEVMCRSKFNSLARKRKDATTTSRRGIWFKKDLGIFVVYYRNNYLGSTESYKEALRRREQAELDDTE